MSEELKTLTGYWQRHFDENVEKYGDDPAKVLDYKNAMIMNQIHESIMEVITPEPGARLLDAGCGLGDLTRKFFLETDKNGFEFFHVELSGKMLLQAKKHLSSRIGNRTSRCSYLRMDIMALGFGDRIFDFTISVESLQHVNIGRGIAELVRVTKDGGMIAISIPNKKNPIIRKAEARNHGRFQGADAIAFSKLLQNTQRVRRIRVKPLLFAEDQRKSPYSKAAFKSQLTAEEQESANRFVFCIDV